MSDEGTNGEKLGATEPALSKGVTNVSAVRERQK
jgi:hypothetical protein